MTSRKRLRTAATWVVAGVLAAMTGCSCSPSIKTVKPSLSVTPSSLDFGLVAVGQASQPLTVMLQANTGAAVTVMPPIASTTAPPGASVFSISGTPPGMVTQFAPGQIAVTFTPSAAAVYAGNLKITSNDAMTPEVDIFLSGQGSEPSISVKPTHLGLTAVACPPGIASPRCEDSESVTISNTGLVPLTLSMGGVFIGPATGETTTPANLKLANQVDTQMIAPSGTLQVTVVWEPAGVIPPTPDAGLEIDAGDEDAGVCVVPSDGGTDAGAADGSVAGDAGVADAGGQDAGLDAGATDAGPGDGGVADAGSDLGEVGNFAATLVIKSNDPSNPEVDVPIAATGLPVAPPTSCIKVTSVTEREYMTNPTGGAPTVQQMPVPATDWQDPMIANLVHVRPGMTLSLTSSPCTTDPNGFTLTKTWTLATQPALSSASVQPMMMGTTAVLEIDAAGEYAVQFQSENNIGLSSPTSVLNIDAIPRDDLFAQLSWKDGPGIDLDIHVLVDQGPGIGAPPANKHEASLFCTQDCFFFNFSPTWFAQSTADEIPHLLRDDQGTSGELESIELVTAPPNSVFRVAAHYWNQGGSVAHTTPQITIRHQTTPYGPGGACDMTPFTPPGPLVQANDAWFGVQVSFDADSNITVTGLDGGVVDQDAGTPNPPGSTYPPNFIQDGIVACP